MTCGYIYALPGDDELWGGMCARHGWEAEPATSKTVAVARLNQHREEQGENE